MNGLLFKVRHKEWNIECFRLVIKTLPWLVLLILPLLIFQNISGSILENYSVKISDPIQQIMNMALATAVIIASFLFWAASPFAQSGFILIHRIDNGMKNDPVTALWYILRDKSMWLDHLSTVKRLVPFVFGFYGFIFILSIIAILTGNEPDSKTTSLIAEQAKTLKLSYDAFYTEHFIMSKIKDSMTSTYDLIMICIVYREMWGGFNFNSFMQANSYKSTAQCRLDAIQAKDKLKNMKLFYVHLPFLATVVWTSFVPSEYIIASFMISILNGVVAIYCIHMNYIIGRDYYIGPPAKNETEKSFNAHLLKS